jgi:hypothetical protein
MEDEAKVTKLKVELQAKERELERCQEVVSALQDAHRKAHDRALLLSSQLESYKQHASSLRRELESNLERESAERRDRRDVRTHWNPKTNYWTVGQIQT